MENSISYNYIQVGKEIWYKNPLDSPTDMPFLLSTVKSKDDLNKICILLNGESVQYINTLPYYNDININTDDLSLLNDINEMDILNNLLNRFSSKIYFTNIGDILLFLNSYINKEYIYNDEILFLYNKKNIEIQNTIYMQPHLYKKIYNILKKLKEENINKQTILIQGEGSTGKTEIINQSIKYILNYIKNNDINNSNKDNNYILKKNATMMKNIDNNENSDSNIFNNDKSIISNDDGYYSIFNYKIYHAKNNENISKKIIASNIVLDAFGNAKTLNNNSSTRFIKYIKLKFDQNLTKIKGGEIYAFLFDKNRVSNLESNKGNNFNIFYYLLKCGNNELLQKLFLYSDNISNYNYLNSNNTSIDNSTYTKNKFKEIKEALIILGFNNGEMFTIFKILSSIILLGNIDIKIDNNYKLILNQNDTFLNICNLLNIDCNEFIKALVNQKASMGNNNLSLNKDYNTFPKKNNYNFYNENEEIERIKNIFANELYNQLFLWIVNKINNSINNYNLFEDQEEKTITFFDFCGYENNYSYKYNDIIYLNALEQLFINYMNEFIFYFYLKDYYITNLKLFQKEGFNYIVEKIKNQFNNKKDILNSINYLLNELKNMQNDKDITNFISNLEKDTLSDLQSKRKYKKVKSCKVIKNSTNSKYFLIHHTNEDVFYNLNGFLNKNINNFIPWNLLDCLLKSNNPIIRNIYKNNRINNISEKKSYENNNNYDYENIINNGFITLGEEYKCFIKEIKKEIKQSQRNYIICIKSNQSQKPLVFTPNYIFNQIKYFKILFSIKQLKQQFFPIIINFGDFYNNYKITQEFKDISEIEELIKYNIDSNSNNSTDIYRKACNNIINDLINYNNNNNKESILLSDDLILFGKNKILMKEKIYNILEKEKNKRIEIKTKAINNIIVAINYFNFRIYLKEFQNKKIIKKISKIQALIKTFTIKIKMKQYNELIYFVQNSLRIICARKKIEIIKNNNEFIIIRLKMFLEKIKKKGIYLDENNKTIKGNNEINNGDMNNYSNNEQNIIKNSINNYKDIPNNDNNNILNENKNNISNILKKNENEINNNLPTVNGDNNKINFDIDNIQNIFKNIDKSDNIGKIDENKKEVKNENDNDNGNTINLPKINKNLFNNYNKLKGKNKEKRLSIINQNQNNLNPFLKKKDNNINLDKNPDININININNIKKVKKPLNINQIKCKNCFKIFQENLLFHKINEKKKNIKLLYNHAYSKFFSRYYNSMKKEIKIIKNYINKYFKRQKILNEVLHKYINNIPNNYNDIDKKINKILFPYRKGYKEEEEEDNKNKTINISINNLNNKINESNYNKDLNKLKKEEENDINNSLNSNEKEDSYIISKLIKNIPNLSINKENLSKNILLSSIFNNNRINKNGELNNNKLYFLSKLIDIDILTEIFDEQYNEVLWVQEYKKIYEFNLINKTPIQQIYLSNTHALLINNIGHIFLFGLNEKDQCTLLPNNNINEEIKNINFNYLYSDISLTIFQFINNLYGNIDEAILGEEYTLILNNKGKVYSFGDYLKPNIINSSNINCLFNNKKIKMIRGNGSLNIFLTNNNELFLNITTNKEFLSTNNSNNNYFHHNIPIQIFFDKKIKITSISCGFNFYVLLSSDGKLYSGGSNEHGELCSNDININQRLSPEEIYEVSKLNEKIIQVSCGFKHVIALSSTNNVFGWGNNSYGQLFSKDICIKSGILKLNNDNKNKIIQICAGFRSSFILNDNNEIFYFGILNRKKKNISGEKEKIFIEDKNYEYSNKNFFVPIKINARWNTLFSLFYVTFADIRNFSCKIEYNNKKNEDENIKDILKIVSTKWLNDSVKIPYIPEIGKYINNNYMEKPIKSKSMNDY